ncbi:MAG: porin [Candidatus Eiseniibacteriota bacterium]
MKRLALAVMLPGLMLACPCAFAQVRASGDLGLETVAPTPAAPPARLGGYIQFRETDVQPTGLTATLNRARLSGDGTLPWRFSYRVLVEYQAASGPRTPSTVSLREAYARWAYWPVAFTFGQNKVPFSREYLVPVTSLETADLSTVVDSLAPKYDIGITGECAISAYGSFAVGVYNGEGQNASLNRDSTVLWVSRLTLHPVSQLSVAGNVAYYSQDSTRYGADASLEQSGAVLRGEVIGMRKSGRARDDFGWYTLAGFRPIPLIQLVCKLEDFQRPSLGQARRISAITGGLNLDLPGGRTRLIVNEVARKSGYPRVKRNSFIAQLQVRF